MNKALGFIHENTPVLLATVLAFAAGLLAAEATQPEPKAVYLDVETVTIRYDYSRLTMTTCKTSEECGIAEAIAFYNDYAIPLTAPVLEPADCSDLPGRERQACEQSNKNNAGKTAVRQACEQSNKNNAGKTAPRQACEQSNKNNAGKTAPRPATDK